MEYREPLGNGHINRTFRVTCSSGSVYTLQRINRVAFHHPEELVENIRMGLIEKKGNAPHLKVYGLYEEDFVKGSMIGVDYDTEYEHKLAEDHENLRIILNARVTCPARPFSRLADDALDDLCDAHDLECQVFFTECFGMSDEGRR